MGIFIGNYDAKTLAVGDYNAKTAYVGSYLVFGDDAVYTYELTDVSVRYSTSDWINPSLNNYAYLRGTFITYKNGREEKREDVELTIDSVSSDYLVNNENYVTWNYDKYKTTETSWTSVTIRGNYAGYTAEGTVSVAANYNNVLVGAEIYDFKLGDHTSPYTIGNSSQTLDMYVRLGHIYNWTSGEYSHTNEYEAYNVPTNLIGQVQELLHTRGSKYLYYFKNNSSVEIRFTACLEDTYSWWDPVELMPESNTVYTYADIVLAPGESTTVELAADASEGIDYQGSHSDREYFTIGGEKFILSTTSQTYTGNYPVNNWVDFDEAVSWLSITDMTVSINQNTGSSRSGTIIVKDKVFPTVTKSFTLVQEETSPTPTYTYVFEPYGTQSTNISAFGRSTSTTIKIQSTRDDAAWPITASDIGGYLIGTVTVNSGTTATGYYEVVVNHGPNESDFTRIIRVIMTQPDSGKKLMFDIEQSSGGIRPIDPDLPIINPDLPSIGD